jgi:hypothetical protein
LATIVKIYSGGLLKSGVDYPTLTKSLVVVVVIGVDRIEDHHSSNRN